MEATLILATIAQQYRLRLTPGQQAIPQATLTLRPKHNLMMSLEARQLAEENETQVSEFEAV
jgi:cytochrome P450